MSEPPGGGWYNPLEEWRRAATKTRALAALVTALVLAYCVVMATHRFEGAFDEWRAETDTKQVTFQYYRYTQPGTLPLGHLMTDYAYVYNAPPVFHAIMAPLSYVMDAKDAASLVNVVLWVLALVAAYFAVGRHTNHWLALTAVLLLARSHGFFRITAGGYGRTFGPTLVLLFLAAWLSGKRRVALVLLLVMAGTYPPVMMTCALGFGVWTLYELYRDRKWRPVIELAVVALGILLLAMSQNLQSPEWWGSTTSYEEALKNPAWRSGGRIPFVPHRPYFTWPWVYVKFLLNNEGRVALEELSRWNVQNRHVLTLGLFLLLGLLGALRRSVPGKLIVVFLAGFGAYALSRQMAFHMHAPHRPMAHAWPYILAVAFPIFVYKGLEGFLSARRWLLTAVAFVVVIGPVFLLHGDGWKEPRTYRDYGRDKELYMWVRENTPKDAVFAGNFQPMDEIPLFAWRVPYVNWKLAHPFRAGYWDEVVRRTREMYRAYYATDLRQVVAFAEQEKVDFFIVDRNRYKKLERGDGQLFPPLRGMVQPMFNECRKKGCVLEKPPEEAVVFTQRNYKVLDLAKLKAFVADNPLNSQD